MKHLKTFSVIFLVVPLLAIILSARTTAAVEDIAATYKAKCAACHGAKSEKAFDPSKADAVLVEAVLKGVKPKMPAYDGKISVDDASALVAYMKSLRQ